MTIAPRDEILKARRKRSSILFERGMAIFASINLGFVIFDVSYIPLRDFWLQGRVQLYARIGKQEWKFPPEPIRILPINVAQHYDWVKGIEPHRDTTHYLETVDTFKQKFAQFQALESTSTNNPPNTDSERENLALDLGRSRQELSASLSELQNLSIDMIETNPFAASNQSGTLEKIKNRMRRHIFNDVTASAKESFKIYWSIEHLTKQNGQQELAFFDQQIRPLMAVNYYRPVGENGRLIDNFGIIDAPFFLIFLLEFLARSWYISIQRTGVTWFEAMLWRWYDLLFLIPLFRWLRVIPVTVRLSQANLIDLTVIQKQLSQGFVAGIAEDITEVVFIRVINQVQGSIRRGEFSSLLSQATGREYVDLNNTNETIELVKLFANLVVCQVMPKIRPEAEALMKHTVERVITLSPAYQGLQALPGAEEIKVAIAAQLSHQVYQLVFDTLQAVLEKDPIFDELFDQLTARLTETVGSEMQAKESLERMESLLSDLLEEIKINYVERLSEDDVEDILEQTRILRQINKG